MAADPCVRLIVSVSILVVFLIVSAIISCCTCAKKKRKRAEAAARVAATQQMMFQQQQMQFGAMQAAQHHAGPAGPVTHAGMPVGNNMNPGGMAAGYPQQHPTIMMHPNGAAPPV